MKYIVEIPGVEDLVEFSNGKKAVEYIDSHYSLPSRDGNYNPVMVLRGYGADGLAAIEIDREDGSPVECIVCADNPGGATGGANSDANKSVNSDGMDREAVVRSLLELLASDSKPSIDVEQVRGIVSEEVKKLTIPRPISVKVGDLPEVNVATPHAMLPDLVSLLANRISTWLTGPAGSGKTTGARQAAEALGIPFYSISVCSQTTKTDLFGYNDANGRYVGSLFHKAYSEGGVFLIDEIDAGNPNVLSALNAAIENDTCAFPCGMVDRHPDFVVVAAANTIGAGASMQYVGRNPIDKATIDRFAFIHWGYDETLEITLSGNEAFAKRVQAIRAKAEKLNMNCIISPRGSIKGAKLIASGMSEKRVLEMLIFDKMNAAERSQLETI